MCLLAECAASFKDNLVLRIRADEKRLDQHLSGRLMLVTALNPHVSLPTTCAFACPLPAHLPKNTRNHCTGRQALVNLS